MAGFSDRILIKGIRFRGHHGVPEEEQSVGGAYEVDVELIADLSAACRSDRVEDTIDYTGVYELVVDLGTRCRFRLLEALAHGVAEAVLKRFPARQVRIQVRKLHPPLEGVVDFTAVEITRGPGDV